MAMTTDQLKAGGSLGGASNSLGDTLKGLLGDAGSLAAVYAAYDLPQDAIDAINKSIGELEGYTAQTEADARGAVEFQPFSVRTGSGTTTVGPGGDIKMDPSGALGALTNRLQEQAQSMAMQDPVTAQGLFGQLSDMRRPEVERERLAMESRLAAQGRLGTQTAAFGGTPEALAMEKAIQEQRSSDMFQAQQLAPQLQAANLANIGTALGTSFAPENQGLAALAAGTNIANLAQQGRQGEMEAIVNLAKGMMSTKGEGAMAVSGIEQARADAYSKALQGLFASGAGGESTAGSLIDGLVDLYDFFT